MSEYLTVEDLKKILHIGNDKAYKLCGMRGFPAFRIGEGQWLIDPNGLQEWVGKLQKTNTKTVSLGMVFTVGDTEYTAEEFKTIMECVTPDD